MLQMSARHVYDVFFIVRTDSYGKEINDGQVEKLGRFGGAVTDCSKTTFPDELITAFSERAAKTLLKSSNE